MKYFKNIIYLLSPQELKNFFLLLAMIIIMAFLDMLGVASILPFVAVLTNPNLIETNIFLIKIFEISKIFGIKSNEEFLFVLGTFVFIFLIISLIFKSITLYAQVRFTQMRQYSISKRLIEGYLHQPYSWFLSQNRADLGKTILSEVDEIIAYSLKPVLEIISKSAIVLTIITLLILVDPKIAIASGIFIFMTYGIIFYCLKNLLAKLGSERLKNNEIRFRTVGEAFGAAKEVKISGLEKSFIRLFSITAEIIARNIAKSEAIGILPRFILETIAFGGILILILITTTSSGNINLVIPILSLYLFAAYRLMPAIQQIYMSFTRLKFASPTLDKVINDLKNLKPKNINLKQENLKFSKKICLNNVYYNYPNSERTVLKNINLSIFKNSCVGFIGQTGCGKTTIIDIILGLLDPQKGTLEIDEQIITEQKKRSWQRSIGYVPQQIFLSDNTIEANIAFGVEPKEINHDLVKKVSKIANLYEFIEGELPDQYKTNVGDHGIKLSGGQRQRIGIARALYHNPEVLIFDEATSALDNETEKVVMDAIYKLRKDLTIILIAHRLNTLKNCDIVFKLDKGRLIKQGKYNEFIKSS